MDGTADTISGLTAPDDNTVVFQLTETSGPFAFSILTQHSIIPQHVWADVPPEEMVKPGTWETGQIGTGPFQFDEYVPDQYLRLTRYDDAWRGAPLLDEVLFVHVGTTPEAWGAALEAGDLDYTQIASTDFDRMSGIENLTVGVQAGLQRPLPGREPAATFPGRTSGCARRLPMPSTARRSARRSSPI